MYLKKKCTSRHVDMYNKNVDIKFSIHDVLLE